MKNNKYSFAYPEWINKNKILDPKRLDILRRTRDKIYSAFPNRVKFFKPVSYLNSDPSAIIQDFKIFGKLSNAYIFRLWLDENDKCCILGTYIPDGDLLKPAHVMIQCDSIKELKMIIDEINLNKINIL